MPENVFADEWRECLEAHYMHVIRTKDRVTEPSLTVVMGQAGFNKSELAELRVRATMHVDQSGEDFVPDLEVLDAVAEVEAEARIFAAAVPDVAPSAEEMPPPVIEAEQLIAEVEEAVAEVELLDAQLPPDEPAVIEAELPVEQLIEEIEESAQEDELLDEEPPPEDPDAPQQLTLF